MATSVAGAHGTQFDTSNAQSASAAQGILNAAGTDYAANGGTLPAGSFAATNGGLATYTGSGAFQQGVLTGQGAVYQSGTASYATVYAGDNTNSTIENNNPTGALFGFFGAGNGAGLGLGEANTFTTDPGATATFAFGILPGETAQANTLYSSGQDTVTVNGPMPGHAQSNEIVTAGTGADSVSLLGGAPLSFINGSSGTSTIEGSAGSSVSIGGGGATSVQAGAGAERFSVDTASGNVTLTGGTGSDAADAFDFTHAGANEASTGTASAVVNNFVATDTISLTGYGTAPGEAYTVGQTSTGATQLTLSDGTKLSFANVPYADATTVTSHITLR